MKKLTILLLSLIMSAGVIAPVLAKQTADFGAKGDCGSYYEIDGEYTLCRSKYLQHVATGLRLSYNFLTDATGKTTAKLTVSGKDITTYAANLALNAPQEFVNSRGMVLVVTLYQLDEANDRIILQLKTNSAKNAADYIQTGFYFLPTGAHILQTNSGITFQVQEYSEMSLRLQVENSDRSVLNVLSGASRRVTAHSGQAFRLKYVTAGEDGVWVFVESN